MNNLSLYWADLISAEWGWGAVATNLTMSIVLLIILSFKMSLFLKVDKNEEITKKDNPAMGIALGMAFLSLLLIMSGASTGSEIIPLVDEIILMGSYGIGGIVMLLISRVVVDKISMKSFCLQDEIRKQNVAAGIVDGGNMLATAIIVFAYMGWVKGTSIQPLCLVVFGWIMSQVLLSLVSFLRAKLYKSSDGSTLESSIKDGNVAVAMRYIGYKLSFALSPLIAVSHYPYDEDNAWWLAVFIFISSILLSTVILLLTTIVKKILIKTNYSDEINKQKNIGLAVIEVCIVLGLTFLIWNILK